MTLAAIKKLAVKLPLKQRIKLAEAMWESIPPMREPVTLAELERRADEVFSGKVKAISEEEFDRELAEMERSVTNKHLTRHNRSALRGKTPGPANSRIRA